MKTKATQILKLFTILFCMVIAKAGWAQTPTVEISIRNDVQVSPTEYEFDIYLTCTNLPSFQMSGHQYGINYNPAIKPAGATITLALVGGTSELTNPAQLPISILYHATLPHIRIQAPPAPGAGNGSIIQAAPGTRMSRLRLTCSAPFSPASPNLEFQIPNVSGGTRTLASAYVGTVNTPLTIPPSTVAYVVSNPILNNVCGNPPTASAGSDFSACADGSQITLNGTAGGAATTGTFSGGTGIFDTNGNIATYTPSAADYSAGSVTFTYTTEDPDGSGPCVAATATVTVTFSAPVTVYADLDNDGYGAGAPSTTCNPGPGTSTNNLDCDDTNSAINPGATESCNGIDDDCANGIDDGIAFVTYYQDSDGDSYGNPAVFQETCDGPPSGYVANDDDCNDLVAAINPGAAESCNGIDDNCDGNADEGIPYTTYYADADNDGFGNAAVTDSSCDGVAPAGFVANSDDCNDADGSINPNALEVCDGIDNNCNGTADEGLTFITYFADADGDTYGNSAISQSTCNGAPVGYVISGGDCNDGNPAINPGASEVCNGIDDDCDGNIDDGLTFTTYYADADNDNYGDDNDFVSTCDGITPVGYVAVGGDCDDANPAINPGASEVCNGVDDDCDGSIDDGLTFLTYYVDNDNDSYGTTVLGSFCSAPANGALVDGDCNDAVATINPGAPEQCNNIDDDCDGTIDDGVTTSTWYADADGDGFGNPLVTVDDCAQPTGYVLNDDDCDDTNEDVNPDAIEVCNSIDDDCDGTIDEDGTNIFYADNDDDGYGDITNTTLACFAPDGYVAVAGDCDDNNMNINPGASESCNGIDDNCNGFIDEGVLNTYYADSDGDTYGDPSVSTTGCTAPVGYVGNDGDCDDDNSAINPAAAEQCNNIDDNCDGNIDEGLPQNTFYADADGDGFGDFNNSISTCSATAPSGYTTDIADCNDGNAAVNPSATEVCGNFIDDNCDGTIDEGCGCVNPPTAQAGNDQSVCEGEPVVLSGTIGGGATNGTWSTSGSGTFSPSANDLNATYNPSAGDYTAGSVVLTLTTDAPAGCPPASDDITVTFTALPDSPGTISGPSAICNPFNQAITYSIAPVPGASSYTWTVPPGTNILSGQGTTSILVSWPFSAIHNGVVGDICVSANTSNGCGNSTPSCLGISVQLTIPVTPPSISGPNKACVGDIGTYSIALVARADSYNWSVPAGATILSGQGTNIITVQYLAGFAGGVMNVTAENACGVSPARTKGIGLNILPAPAAISGPSDGVCAATGVVYSIPPVTGASSYQWTVPAGASIVGSATGSSITVDFTGSFTSGPITVRALNNCGQGSLRSMTVRGVPAQAGVISGPTSVCANQTYTYEVATVAGASTYIWTVPGGATITGGAGTKTISVQFGPNPTSGQSISVRTSNSCGTSPLRLLSGITVTLCPRIGDMSDLSLNAYPNPASDLLNITFVSDKTQDYTVRMQDATGRTVMAESKVAAEGSNHLEMSVKGLASGIYMMQFQMNDRTEQIRIFVD